MRSEETSAIPPAQELPVVATAAQLKALVRSRVERDDERFMQLAIQIAAHEAKQGHKTLAQELRDLVDEFLCTSKKQPTPLAHPRGELAGVLTASYPDLRLGDMVLQPELRARLDRIVLEQRAAEKLERHGLEPRRKVLLLGPPGSGKSMTGAALAGELRLPLFVIRLDSLMTRFMGETAAKLRLVFAAISDARGVYLFDEFDSIGAQRGAPNEVGEIRRVLNTFLQAIETERSRSLILAATNHPEVLDKALYRRFDDVLEYGRPDKKLIRRLIETRLAGFMRNTLEWEEALTAAEGHSSAEIVLACADAAKAAVLDDRHVVDTKDLTAALQRRGRLKG